MPVRIEEEPEPGEETTEETPAGTPTGKGRTGKGTPVTLAVAGVCDTFTATVSGQPVTLSRSGTSVNSADVDQVRDAAAHSGVPLRTL